MRVRGELRYLAELAGVCGFAVALPTLGVFGDTPETFIFEGLSATQIVLFALLVVAVPPVVAWVPGALARLVVPSRVGRWLQAVTIGALTVGFATDALRDATSLLHRRLLVASIAVGVAAMALYLLFRWVREFALFSVVAPVLALAQFLALSPVSAVVFPAPGGTGGAEAPPVPVVFLLFDEFATQALLDDAGGLDSNRFPGFARLAASSTWYRDATTVAGVTTRAIPVLVSGRFVPDEQAAVARHTPDNLFTWLGPTHDMHVAELVTRLCPPKFCDPPRRGTAFDLVDDARTVWWDRVRPDEPPPVDTAQFEEAQLAVDADRANDTSTGWDGPPNPPGRFVDFVDGFDEASGARPALHFLHLTLPHHPFRYYPSGTQYAIEARGVPGRGLGTWLDAPSAAEVAHLRYVMQVEYVDELVDTMIDRLEAAGLWDDALVVVTADHGVSFVPSTSNRGFDPRSYEQIMWAPLFVKAPHQSRGVVSDDNVMSIDVLPTIADLLGVELPWRTDGRSAISSPRRDDEKTYLLSAAFEDPASDDDGRVVVDGREGWARLVASSPLGHDDASDPLARYRVGRRPALLGRSIRDLRVEARASAVALYGGAAVYDDVDLDGGEVPASVHGLLRLTPAERTLEGREVLVALNGRIAGVVRSFNDFDGEAFGAFLPEQLFREGRNELRVFEVVERARGLVLRELTVER